MTSREGSLEAPIRHPVDWESDSFSDPKELFDELKRVFEICNGCRRCFNLCDAFPKLFDLIDETPMGDTYEVDEEKFWDVIDSCYLCDICFKTKCPYVPPHEFNVDFPHLMLRAKALKHKTKGPSMRDNVLSNPEKLGNFVGIPIVTQSVNALNQSKLGSVLVEKTIGIDRDAPKPKYYSSTARKQLKSHIKNPKEIINADAEPGVVLFATCYGNRNDPKIVEDTVKCFEVNNVPVVLSDTEKCCGMPKLELGDIESVQKAKDINVPELFQWAEKGWKIVSPIPSCVLMFKQELPLLFPNDEKVDVVAKAFMDPFDYLFKLDKKGLMNKSFKTSLGSVFYQVPCHLRVQSIGLKTRDVLELIPDTKVTPLEKCSGHDGTYGVKKEYRKSSVKIARPIVRKLESGEYDSFTSDCPMAGAQIDSIQTKGTEYFHPMSLLRQAYGE
ncbi:MAG TPA: heterodisulfide reductase-related iron-sulfur binding cluster [Gammaproteobacteria bacterium]|jgi:Fe-S oxidoreductase|nr:heterodisulfide reductase-related iron-sulfur binding cluster [Gammaproteobacteria bacterium]